MNSINLSIINTYMKGIDLPVFEIQSSQPFTIWVDPKIIINITEHKNRIALFSSCGKNQKIKNNFDDESNRNESVTWLSCKGMDERFNYKIGHYSKTNLFILHSSAETSLLDSVTFSEWVQEFIVQTKNWRSVIASDDISACIGQQYRLTQNEHISLWA